MFTCAPSKLKRNETVRPANTALPQLGFLCFQPRMLDNKGNSRKVTEHLLLCGSNSGLSCL